MKAASLPIASIRIDGGTQPRSKIDEAIVVEYAEAMNAGAAFPPVVVFQDGVDHWLADGFHRFHAVRSAGKDSIHVELHDGTKRDAILYSVGANSAHGQRRTNEDKRRAVLMLLGDVEWSRWSESDVSRQCNVSRWMVHEIKASLAKTTSEPVSTERKYTNKHGTVSTMRTENIGRRTGEEREPERARQDDMRAPDPAIKSRGVGLGYAHKAISYLQQIPLDDGLRDDAMDTVIRWIEDNR